MSVEVVASNVIVRPRKDPLNWVWGPLYMGLGCGLASLPFLAGREPDPAAITISLVLGSVAFAFGVSCVLSSWDTVVFDPLARTVSVRTWSWIRLGFRSRTIAFDTIQSVGVDTFRNPRTRAKWAEAGRLRLKTGDSVTIEGVDDWSVIAQRTGIGVSHEDVLLEEPASSS